MRKSLTLLLGILLLVFPLLFLGCTGDDGDNGAAGLTTLAKSTPEQPGANCPNGGFLIETGTDNNRNGVLDGGEVVSSDYVCNGTDLAGANPESCSVCHHAGGSEPTGSDHQADYNQYYQDGVIVVTNLAYTNNGVNDIVTFDMTKNGVDFDCRNANASPGSLGIYWIAYTGTGFEMASLSSLNIEGTLTYDGAGGCTSTKAQSALGDLDALNGLVVVYGRETSDGRFPNTRFEKAKNPFAQVLETGPAGVDYVSAANNDGCEKCHTIPFLKHGYIYGQVDQDPATDFYVCKACHIDNVDGGHFEWQLLVTDPDRAASYLGFPYVDGEPGTEVDLTPAEAAQYAYKRSLMNDVHMSHAMEFPYPQSMANCATCHEGKLGVGGDPNLVTTDANFVAETCKSCHAVSGPGHPKQAPPITEIAPSYVLAHNPPFATVCNVCHSAAGGAPLFSAIHTGYDKQIYSAPDEKYSESIEVTIDSASIAGNVLSFAFSATGSAGGVDSANIEPTVLVGLYGWDTKDFYVGPHRRTIDGDRDLEASGSGSGRITITSVAAGSWTATANLSAWAAKIADGTIKRAEIGIIPRLRVNPPADNTIVALNAPSVTFSIADNAVVTDPYGKDIVKVETGCNNCHDALGTTFHSPDRGGNIVICRLCHVTLDDGSHLEMQSRSITSYAHAIHSFQYFDSDDVDFTDPVEEMHYVHHTEFVFPTFGVTNCESCHNEGKYNVPDQFRSMGGLLSASYTWTTKDRNIGNIPPQIIGAAGLACGACHRAMAINEDDAGELASLFSHWKTMGYLIENKLSSSNSGGVYPSLQDALTLEVIEAVMALI